MSPASKSGRSEKGARNTVDGSPSAKGTLESYLVTSQEKSCAARLSYTNSDSLPRENTVRRILSPVIDSSVDNEDERPVLSAQIHQFSQANKKGLTSELSKVSNAAVEQPVQENCSDCRQGEENLELRQFASDFLSLYCRYFTPSIRNFGFASKCQSFTVPNGDEQPEDTVATYPLPPPHFYPSVFTLILTS